MTSLSKQLQNLAVPQTSCLVDLKKRASILFDAKEAATKDRKTIFDLGSQGLTELIALNHSFAQFEKTLFQHSSIQLERSVEDKATNKALDNNIQKFLLHLSPYFMLRSSHMCLEWLIRRFQVHEYNKSAVMCLILPYHETNIFVKCVQILRIKNPSDPWNWLLPIQKPGIQLTKSTIINRATNEQNFLSFVCKLVMDTTKELESRASTLQCVINFYCTVIVGALENCIEIKEWHITTILPSVSKGLKSGVVDFASASLIITLQLVSKTKLNEKLLNALVSQICKINNEHLQTSVVMLLNWISKTQSQNFSSFSHKGFVEFISNKWLTTAIANCSREGISMHYIIIPLIRTTIDIIQSGETDAKASKVFFEILLNETQLNSVSAKIVIRSLLQNCSIVEDRIAFKDGDVIELESDCEMQTSDNTLTWYSSIVKNLERQYPIEMDEVLKEIMQSNNSEMSKKAINMALSFRYKFLDVDSSSIFQDLYHTNPNLRAMSVQKIVDNINQSGSNGQYHSLLADTLSDRIKDDNEKVIDEILKLSTQALAEILGHKVFVENLIEILDKSYLYPDTWGYLQTDALIHLTSDIVVKNYDNNVIFLVLMRYLFPVSNDEQSAQYIALIMKSQFVRNLPLLNKFNQKFEGERVDPVEFKKRFLDLLAVSDEIPCVETLYQSIQKNKLNYFKTAVHVSYFLMIIPAFLKTNGTPENTLHLLKVIGSVCSRFKMSHFNNNEWKSAIKMNSIPSQLFMDFLFSSVHVIRSEDLLIWEFHTKSLELFLELLSILTSNAFSLKLKVNEKRDWVDCLKHFLHSLCPTLHQKRDLLSHFFIHENMNIVSNYGELRIRAFKITIQILNSCTKISQLDLRFILKTIVALSSPSATIRTCALDVLRKIISQPPAKESTNLAEQIVERYEEIQIDSEQISLILFTILGRKKDEDGLLYKLLRIIEDPKEGTVFKSRVLELFKHIKGKTILRSLIPMALNALNNAVAEGSSSTLENASACIFKSVIRRFDDTCINQIIKSDKQAWELIERSLKMPKTFTISSKGKRIPISCITLQIFDESTYNQLPDIYQVKLIKLIVESISLSDNDALILDINKVLRRVCLDCKHILPLLERMNDIGKHTEIQQTKKYTSKENTENIYITTLSQWKEGVILLEILENKKRIQNSHVLIPTLFDILKKCLDMDNQSPLEYTKQLILSALLQSCQIAYADCFPQDIPHSTLRIDLVIQCIRSTPNPQTHYNALLLLSHCAVLSPQQVLHSLVDIFTFMGSSIARHDDVFSFQVISNIVESIIPILVKEKKMTSHFPKNDLVLPVLKIFSDILFDVPEHRRLPLYTKLLHTLGPEQYLWLFICVVFESQVINDENKKLNAKKNDQQILSLSLSSQERLPKRVEIVLELLNEFSTNISLQTCVSLLAYVKSLPMNKDETVVKQNTTVDKPLELELFDVGTRTAKQLRHYKYLILQFTSTFTSNVEFLKAISALNENESKLTKSLYQNFIIKVLSYIPDVTSAIEKSADRTQSKFWKVILHHCYESLDNVILLLAPDMFLVVVNGLMHHKLVTIRKKVIELLISKCQERNDYFENCSKDNILNLLDSLYEVLSSISLESRQDNSFSANETVFVQQAALVAVKLFSKTFSLKYIDKFKNVIVLLTTLTKKRKHMSKVLFATIVLTIVEVASNLKAHSISHLPKFMPHLIDALKDQVNMLRTIQSPDNVCLSLITGIQSLFESMPLFLGPYTIGIITMLSSIWSRILSNEEHRTIMSINRLTLLWAKIATEVPARILIPSCKRAYYNLMEDKSYSSIIYLMKLFLECISNSSNSDLSLVQSELTELFLECLEFRTHMRKLNDNSAIVEEICKIEMEVINAFVAWILKLSENSFRPVYKKVYDWALRSNGQKERVLTFFILNNCIANSLKSLFVLFATELMQDAAELLNLCNTSKNDALYFTENEMLNMELAKNILSTLTIIFVHDTERFANEQSFRVLMQPIVDQLENNLVLENNELQSILMCCIGQLAVAVTSDVLRKQLNYQILLKTRRNLPQIKVIAFNSCVEVARKLGDAFISLLPETVPFIAELFENGNPLVVESSRKAVQEIEAIIGEPLQKYL